MNAGTARPVLLLLAALALALAGAIGLELRPGSSDEGGMQAPPPSTSTTRQGTTSGPAPGRTQVLVDTILARPLFAPDRRPPPVTDTAPGAAPAELPRVAGIMLNGSTRSVIFAAATDGGRPVVAIEGATVNGFRVQSIEAGQVTVTGPGGPRVLRPTFDPRPPAPPSPPPGLPGLPSLQNLTGIPGLPPPPAAR